MARRRSVAAAVGLATIVGLVTPLAAAAAILWTLTASPLTATTGVLTQFTLTATNEDLLFNEIGCVVVDVPSNFSVKATAVVSTNANGPWSATADGNRVTVWAGGGGARLELLEWVKFTVDALPLAAGELAWNSNAYEDQQCRGSGSLLGVPPVVLVTGSTVTPSPSPTPTATPTPTPSPTPTPTPLLPLPTVSLTPLPTLEILPTPTPTPTPTPRLTPRPTPTGSTSAPTASATPAPTADDGGSAASPASSPDPTLSSAAASPGPEAGSATPAGPSGRGALARVDAPEDTLELGLGAFGAVEGVEVWFVPAAVIGAPGLLVIVWVALQTIGGVVWLPAVRRMLGDEEPSARRRRST